MRIAGSALLPAQAAAQAPAYPSRPVRQLGTLSNGPVVIENRPGSEHTQESQRRRA
jgi:hypothetical protein